ncbi:S1/P1 Nuclease [Fulvivirgaceae bacterium PWU4]|uniref:S1/P1 Nuclease n=1 Tax=Chryseosolibacter histidini TaxID=2782349 RepID=A0AAP2GRT5_9BACT|nr:zinc dependent phospholipase C family protein [Chryseosolibacter histidini]MBT1699967.1 S1/P1 Nuclease [Chryseosolibacter histidini]
MTRLSLLLSLAGVLVISAFTWGFFAHQHINRLAVFTLPPEMIGFYKKHLTYITEAAVNPDRRRFAVPEEAPRHYLDLDHYGDSALYKMPRFWNTAVERYSEDTLKAYGILPWHIQRMYLQLRDAFLVRDPQRILKMSAEIGHYLADAHVPLHTTENYNGQLTDQDGIHAFWESRLPELFSQDYDLFTGGATYLDNTQLEAWKAIESSHHAVDSVLQYERALALKFGERKYSFEVKGQQTMKVYSKEYARAYHEKLSGMVARQMRVCIRRIGSFWYTAWIDAGQPDLQALINYTPTEAELQQNRKEVKEWKELQRKEDRPKVREHESGD